MNELLRRLLFLPEQASDYARQVDGLHYFIIITTMIAAAGVFATALFFFIRYRRRSDTDVTPHVTPRRDPRGRLRRPAARALPPLVRDRLPAVRAALAAAEGRDGRLRHGQAVDVEVRLPGRAELDRHPARAGGPPGAAAHHLARRDPLASTCRRFRIKQDALPGRYTQTWFEATKPGRYQIFCAEYCGTGHSTMLRRGRGDAAGGVRRWLAEQRRGANAAAQDASPHRRARPPAANLAEEGRRVAAEQGCLKCHTRRRHAAHRPDLGGPLPAPARRSRTARRSSPTRPTSPSR